MAGWLPVDYAFRNLTRSPARLIGLLTGNVLVVLIFITASAFMSGMATALRSVPGSGRVMLLSAGSEESTERSEIAASTAGVVAASIEGIRTTGGVQHVSSEVHTSLPVSVGTVEARAIIRGFTPRAFLVHDRVRLAEGRLPTAGRRELLAGSLAGNRLGSTIAVGSTVRIEDADWAIVGLLDGGGSVVDGEFWMNLSELMQLTHRTTISTIIMELDSGEFSDVDAFCKTRVDLELVALRESDYFASLMAFFRPVRLMMWATAVLMATAGLLGGLNTQYAAFATRAREIGMLQALGYRRRAIAATLAQESVLASAVAFLIASVLALLLLDGLAVRFSMGVFVLHVPGGGLLSGALAALVIALVGAIPPALRCLRMPIPEALKSH